MGGEVKRVVVALVLSGNEAALASEVEFGRAFASGVTVIRAEMTRRTTIRVAITEGRKFFAIFPTSKYFENAIAFFLRIVLFLLFS